MKKTIITLCTIPFVLMASLTSLTACKTVQPEVSRNTLQLELVARHVTGQFGEGAAEILDYEIESQSLYVVNGANKSIDIIDISQLPSDSLTLPYNGNNLVSRSFSLPAGVVAAGEDTLTLGAPTSLSIHNDLLAITVANRDKQQAGAVLFYHLTSNEPELIKAVTVGALPDMLTFTHDGSRVVVANEGEPSDDYSVDPEGSISIINVQSDSQPIIIDDTATHLTFNRFNNDRTALTKTGVKFASPQGTSVAQDLEPEYITISNDDSKAFVSLQENNAIAVINLKANTIEAIKGLGYKDWSRYKIDVSNKDGINAAYYENLYGMYQPDSLASYEVDGKNYILSANEGDAREYVYQASQDQCLAAGHTYDEEDGCISFTEEYRVKKLSLKSPSPIDSYYQKNGIGRLKVTNVLGDDNGDGLFDKLYSYGTRSFSVWDENGNLVFDSGDQIEQFLIQYHGDDFNNNESENKGDNRSDDKGAEPEAIITGVINDQIYAFIGLERQGGIMVYNMTNPSQPSFASYINNRDFSKTFEIDDDLTPVKLEGDYDQVGDLAPEGLLFISSDKSPNGHPLLAVANEVSGSVSIYQIKLSNH